MKRTQLYLDEDLWNALHSQARREGTTVSELVRQAARERYLGNLGDRSDAMMAIIGIRRDSGLPDSTNYIRNLRKGSRLDRLSSGKP